MTAREQILRALRSQAPSTQGAHGAHVTHGAHAAEAARSLPSLEEAFTTYPDPAAKFREVLASVGGIVLEAASLEEANLKLEAVPQYRAASCRVSWVTGLGSSSISLEHLSSPHELESLDFAIAEGELGVAENGAIWVREEAVPPFRAALFLTQHLALVLRRSAIVSNLHEAYARIELEAKGFGAFIAGPSKTADIEQSLVIGAHGPRSLSVVLLG
jgi:L-lactate dehydrogenase complex protein LldG